ncbi:MAG TPA: cytochrome c oxidase subunit II [Solirubrobacterales bacterium]|nr:cytochrome c oxidase subunit II [Solirubrobacterales bacterium]
MFSNRIPIAKMAAAVVVLSAVTCAIMLSINWNGAEDSTAAPKIDDLMNIAIVLSTVIFWIVMVALAYALHAFKVKPGDESDGEPIHGNTRLEIAWTLVPTVIVLFLGGYSWKVLDDIEQPADRQLTVDVFSQQYAWSFGYPGKEYAYSQGVLHVPVNRQIVFKMHAQDVIHSFWVPQWRIKKDNVPGITTTAIVTPTKTGTYQLICTELCGFGHASMRAKVVVEPEAKWEKWVAGLKEKVPTPFMVSVKQDTETNPEPLERVEAE